MAVDRPAETLRENEALLRRIFESVADGIVVVSAEGRIVCVNAQAETLFGYGRGELLGQSVDLLLPERFRQRHAEFRAGYMREPRFRPMGAGLDLVGRRKDGSEFSAHIMLTPVEKGQGTLIIAATRDLTEREQTEEALRARTRQLEAMQAVTEEMARELDLNALLELIHRRAAELVGAGAGTVYLWDEAAQVLVPETWHGYGDWVRTVSWRLGEGVAGVVAQRREAMIVNDYRGSPYVHPLILDRSTVTAVLAVPLLYRDRLLGVISLAYEDPRGSFTEEDRQLLTLFAGPAAIAIENARLYTATARRLAEMTALHDVSHVTTSSLDLDEVLEGLLQRLIQAGAHRAMVSLVEAGGEGRCQLRLAYDASKADPWLRHLDLSIARYPEIQEVVRTRQPLLIPDVLAAPLLGSVREHLEPLGLRSLAVLPLIARGQVIGALSLGYMGQSRTVTNDELRFYRSMADLGATAIANARLFAQVTRAKVEWESTFDSISDFVAVIDTNHRLLRVNRALARRLRVAPEALIGQPCYSVLHGTDCPHPQCLHARTMATGEPSTQEIEDAHLGGIFEVTTSPLQDAEGRPLGCVQIARDITETRRLEEEARQRQRFEDLSRAKSAFIASMSHELRTPLNSILGFADLLLHQDVDPLSEKQARHLGRIHKAGQHLLQLIGSILDLAKVEAGKVELQLESLPVAATLEDILAIAQGLANEKSQILRTEIAPDLPPLLADPVRFKQICFNLLGNAVKFTPPKGEIRLEARRAATDSTLLEIRVTDTGAGIRPEDVPRLFKEFTQLETTRAQHREGTGLGLALTKQLVELHGGRIWAASEGEGAGSTFSAVLPFGGPRAPWETSAGPTSPRNL
jgi:PAS domain S-box-containing protein